MSGARIALHLAYELRRRGGGLGAAALCGGGGQGDALLLRVPAPWRLTPAVRTARAASPASERAGPPAPRGDPASLVAAAREGDPRALARLVSLVENGSPRLREVMKLVAPHTGQARVIGLTGSPGVGKSTITGALVRAYRGEGLRVGVLAVDPTSPFTGGALLGDRVRMQDHATDAGVFIRSMASRGHLGGLSWAAPQALRILDAAGFDVIMIETVGVGQAEVAIASLADSTLVIVAPGMGDSVQAAKAGILEIADIFVVNKSDRPGAQEAIRDLRTMVAMAGYGPGDWKPPIVATTAADRRGDRRPGRPAGRARRVAGRVGGAGPPAPGPGQRGDLRAGRGRAAGAARRAAGGGAAGGTGRPGRLGQARPLHRRRQLIDGLNPRPRPVRPHPPGSLTHQGRPPAPFASFASSRRQRRASPAPRAPPASLGP